MIPFATRWREALQAGLVAPTVVEPALRAILFPTDLSAASDAAFGHARFLAERFGARLTLYHAVEPHGGDGMPPDVEEEAWLRTETNIREFLGHRTEALPGPHQTRVERASSIPRAVAGFIKEQCPDLTIMATHSRGNLARLVLGSVAERVLRLTRSPVLCVREPDHGVALPYRRILVPTDFSPLSRHAFPLASLLARRFDAEVLALHVVRPPGTGSLSGVPELVEATVPEDGAVARFVLPEFLGLRVTPRVEVGSAWEVIVETARSEKADMIVLSTRGRDSLSDRVLGSHAERVVRQAPCPVLVTW